MNTYICGNCHQLVGAKGWGAHINGTVCKREAKIYNQGYDEATFEMKIRVADLFFPDKEDDDDT